MRSWREFCLGYDCIGRGFHGRFRRHRRALGCSNLRNHRNCSLLRSRGGRGCGCRRLYGCRFFDRAVRLNYRQIRFGCGHHRRLDDHRAGGRSNNHDWTAHCNRANRRLGHHGSGGRTRSDSRSRRWRHNNRRRLSRWRKDLARLRTSRRCSHWCCCSSGRSCGRRLGRRCRQ